MGYVYAEEHGYIMNKVEVACVVFSCHEEHTCMLCIIIVSTALLKILWQAWILLWPIEWACISYYDAESFIIYVYLRSETTWRLSSHGNSWKLHCYLDIVLLDTIGPGALGLKSPEPLGDIVWLPISHRRKTREPWHWKRTMDSIIFYGRWTGCCSTPWVLVDRNYDYVVYMLLERMDSIWPSWLGFSSNLQVELKKYQDLEAQARADRDQALKNKQAMVDERAAELEKTFEKGYNNAAIATIAEMRKLKDIIYQVGFELGLEKAQVDPCDAPKSCLEDFTSGTRFITVSYATTGVNV
ncbi:hypothetical protein LguiA_030147 [Lonicera macranthoides]